MQKIFIAILMGMSAMCMAIESEVNDSNGEQNEFWPPDMIPHPNPPWEQPSGPGEPEMA